MKLHKLPYKKISIYIVVLLLSIIGSIYWNRPNKEHFDCERKEVIPSEIKTKKEDLNDSISALSDNISNLLKENLQTIIQTVIQKNTLEEENNILQKQCTPEKEEEDKNMKKYAKIE